MTRGGKVEEKLGLNPWFRIWVSPRRTIRRIVDIDPGRRFVWLSLIYGFPMLLQIAQSLSLALYFSWPVILITALIFAIFIGMLGITITAGLLTWVGKWIGGEGVFTQVRAAVAWANVPTIVTGIAWIVWICLFKGSLFYDGFLQSGFVGMEKGIIMTLATLQFAASVWSFIILLITLSEVQRFSVWKALLNIILPFVLVVIAMWAVIWIVWWIRGFV